MNMKATEKATKKVAKEKKIEGKVNIKAIEKSAQNLVNFLQVKERISGQVTIKGVMSKEGKKYERSFGVFQGTKKIGTYRAMGDRSKRFLNEDGLQYFDL